MADVDLDQDEIILIMKGLNILDRGRMADDERERVGRIAFKLGMASGEMWQPRHPVELPAGHLAAILSRPDPA